MQFIGKAVFLGLEPRSRQRLAGSNASLARRRSQSPLELLGMGVWLTAHLTTAAIQSAGRFGRATFKSGSQLLASVVHRIESGLKADDALNSDDDLSLSSGSDSSSIPPESPHGWRRWLKRPHPLALGAIFVVGAGIYFFAVGRDRYQVTSSFIVRLPQAPQATTSSLLGATVAGPTMLGSLEDGRFLAVYLTSPEVMKRVFIRLKPEVSYAKEGLDRFAGLDRSANFDQQLSFFRRQVSVIPQDLTGVINMTTTGLDAKTSYKLNLLLLDEAERFLNVTNQDISKNQQDFAEQEIVAARTRLDKATAALNAFKDQFAEVDVAQEATQSSNYINQLENKLVDLKVEEAALKRQYKDPATPEVLYVTDQIKELEIQIAKEKRQLVSPEGQNYNRRIAQARLLENEVAFATDALKAAMTFANNRRQETQQQIKFLVKLSDAVLPEMQSYDWRYKGFLAAIGIVIVAWGVATFTLGVVDRK
jgi:capsular polysaccharide transport system permease protein